MANIVSSSIDTNAQTLIHSSVDTDPPTELFDLSISTETQALNVSVSIEAQAPPSDDLRLKLVKEESDLLVVHNQLDSVLMKYSYLGRRQKLRFKDFDNITKLVVASTIGSMKRRYLEVHGKPMVQSDDEAKKLYIDVEKYFTCEYIKKAGTRFSRSLK